MFERIESERLTYERFQESDLEFLYELLSNDEVCLGMPGKKGYSMEIVKKFLMYYVVTFSENGYQKIYKVSLKDTNKPIGYAGIQIVKEFNKYEIFYAFIPEVWNRGLGTEASLKMKSLAKQIGLSEIIALADVENIGSNRVLEKTGFKKISKVDLWGLEMFYYEMNI